MGRSSLFEIFRFFAFVFPDLLGWATASGTTSSTTTESESGTAWSDVGVLFASVFLSLVSRIGWSSWSNTATTWLFIVNNFGLLLHGHWDNFWWEVKVFSEVFNTFVGECPVVMAPGELLLDQATGGQRLAGLDDQEVWDAGDVRVDASLSSLADFFCDHDALTEQVLVNSISLLFSHKHFDRFVPFTAELPLCLLDNRNRTQKWDEPPCTLR